MDKEQAYKIGLAFKLGMIYARGKAHARKLTTDKAEWITVHPNGKENKGRPALIDSTTGQVLGGMGGKFNGKHISIANSKSNKPALLNNQKMGFYDVEKEQDKTSDQYFAQYTDAKLDMDEVQRNQSFIEDINKGDFNSLDDTVQLYEKYKDLGKIVTPKNVYEFKGGKWQDKNGNTVNENMSNRIWDEFKEFKKSSDYGSTKHANQIENEYLLSRGKELDPKTVEKIEKKKEQIKKLNKEMDDVRKNNGGVARTLTQQRGQSSRYAKTEKLKNDIKDLETKLRDKGAEERASTNNKPAEIKSANKADALIGNIKNKKDLQATYKKDFNLNTSSENRADRVPANWSINDIKDKTQQLEQAIKDIDTEKAKIKNAYSGFKDADSKNKLAKEYNKLKSQQSFFKDRIDDMQERFNQLYDNQTVTNQSINNAKQQVQNLLKANKQPAENQPLNTTNDPQSVLKEFYKDTAGAMAKEKGIKVHDLTKQDDIKKRSAEAWKKVKDVNENLRDVKSNNKLIDQLVKEAPYEMEVRNHGKKISQNITDTINSNLSEKEKRNQIIKSLENNTPNMQIDVNGERYVYSKGGYWNNANKPDERQIATEILADKLLNKNKPKNKQSAGK